MIKTPSFAYLPGPWSIAALTAVIRFLYLNDLSASDFFAAPVVDAQTFVAHARTISSGDWLGDEVFWHPPLYTYLLAAVMWLVPEPGFYLAARLVQIILASASAVLVYRLGRRLADLGGAPAWTPAAAGLGFALWGPLIYFDGELLSVSLEVFLYLLLVDRCERTLVTRRGSQAIVAGVVAGLAVLTRPNVLLFLVMAGAVMVATDRRLHRVAILFILPLGLMIGGTALRNWVVADDPVLVSSNGGINFYIGNNARHDSTVAIRPGRHWEDLVAQPETEGYTRASARSDYFYNKAQDFIVHEPLAWLRLLGHKTYQLWSGPELKRNVNPYHMRSQSPILQGLMWSHGLCFPFGVLAPLALLGLWASRHRREPIVRISRWFILAYGLSIVLFFVTARYRAPMVPFLLLYGCFGMAFVLAEWREKRWRQWPLPALLLLTIVVNVPVAADPDQDPQLFHDQGEVALRRGDWDRAAQYSSKAIRLDPNYASAFHNRAVASLYLGRVEAAIHDADIALRLNPRLARSHVLLARAHVANHRPDIAEDHLRRALAIDRDLGEAHFDLGRLLSRSGRLQESLPHLQAARQYLAHDFWPHYETGRVQLQLGQLEAAINTFRDALQREPRVEGYNGLGAAYLSGDRPDLAIDVLDTALQIAPGNLHALTNRGHAALATGHTEEAVGWFRRALSIDPGFAPAQRGIQLARSGGTSP